MTKVEKIIGTDEAWESGTLGNDEAHAIPVGHEKQKAADAAIDAALGLRMISIRLEHSLIDDFKALAEINNIGYQTLMRQALKRFAECEMKRVVRDAAADARAKAEEEARLKAEAASTPSKKVA
jgi:uncharacterized protein (DUF4415 family)